jgi:hypothetical protein
MEFTINAMLPLIFNHYKEHGFHIIIIRSGKYRDIVIVSPNDLIDYEKDSHWTIQHINKFEDISEEFRKGFVYAHLENLDAVI